MQPTTFVGNRDHQYWNLDLHSTFLDASTQSGI